MIDDKDMERLKEIFVTRRECDKNIDGINNKLSMDFTEIAIIKTYQKITLGVLSAVGVGVLGIVLNMIF